MDHIGRYQILGELGRGAMGVVYHALDPSIGREVAIKTIRFADVTNAEQRVQQRERLFREARSSGILSHPGIVTIYDIAEQGETAYIAMEFVSGSTLEQLMSAKEPLEPAFISSILRQTAAALDYAHHKGIIHRDIKPANIIVTEAGIAKIADFGIAKISAADQLTQTGLIVGTPNYMAPEQVQGKPVDGYADQYSLAVVAYEMLTGDKPFVAEHLTTLVYQIVCEAPPPAQRLNPSLGPRIEGVLHRGLSKKKEERFPTCTALVDALEAAFAATPDWKSLGRGASLNLPTMAEPPQDHADSAAAPATAPPSEKPPVTLPPPARSLPAPHAPAREEQELPSRVIPILITLVIGGGLAVGAYYGRQWIYGESAPVAPEPPKPALKQETPPPKAVPAPVPPARNEPEPADQTAPEASPKLNPEADHEKLPEPPTSSRPAPAPRVPREPIRPPRIVTSVELPVRSQPPGATVMLDGLPGTACVTPCVLKAATGEHTIFLTLPGYKTLSRSVTVHDTTVDLPVLDLVQARGVLMVQSKPDGATIMVDDTRWPVPTPAQVTLPPGRYRITVEKGNLKALQTIEIRDGDLRHLIMQLNSP
jgi:serine/threonine-protein kinase